jgi:hypothetical protein
MRGISWIFEQLLASHEGLSVRLFCYFTAYCNSGRTNGYCFTYRIVIFKCGFRVIAVMQRGEFLKQKHSVGCIVGCFIARISVLSRSKWRPVQMTAMIKVALHRATALCLPLLFLLASRRPASRRLWSHNIPPDDLTCLYISEGSKC